MDARRESIFSERSIGRAEAFLEDLFCEQDQAHDRKWLEPHQIASALGGGPLPAVFREALVRMAHRGKVVRVTHKSGTVHYRLRRAELSVV